MKKLLYKILYFLSVIVIIGAVGVFIYHSRIFAADLGGGDQQIIDLGNGLGGKTVKVIINGNNGKIEIEKSLFSGCGIDLAGFQNEAKIRGTISLGMEEKVVEISGTAGAHAENRQFFTIDKNYCPKPIVFVKNGAVSYNIYSDEPSFLLQDFNADGATDLAAEYRNYDLNPIIDGTRDIYLFDIINRQFVLSRSENFQYQELD
ncbi:MAG: hypothetical protein NTY30_04515 [Candidatus Berkelbacteria bacterium]|nr:hypothetical protein [Candidatus Berkelbacteria bacterium]